ncbi:major facilitator superfamily domain-containing protein [Infundibulicybe gibba]|nr:major facilitator superfamily domain-containing protein [Infundibulicybe gibba]
MTVSGFATCGSAISSNGWEKCIGASGPASAPSKQSHGGTPQTSLVQVGGPGGGGCIARSVTLCQHVTTFVRRAGIYDPSLGDNHLNVVWRVSLALGVVPALGVFLWRFNMGESPRYKTDSMKYATIPYILIYRRYGVRLAAISAVWFLYDFVAYPFAIYSSAILNDLTGGSDSLRVIFGWNVVLNMFSLPGSIGGAFLVDYIGAKNTLIIGLVSQVAVGFIMSGLYKQLTNHIAAFTVIYGIFLSFGDFGAGNCTFVLASKAFPTAVRGHFFGIAAAVGKVGAFAGTWGAPSLSIPRIDLVINCSAFPSMIQAFGGSDTTRGNTGPFWVAGGVTMLTAIVAFFFVAPVSRDGMIEEDMRLREYLTLHGYDVSDMGIGRKGDTVGKFIGFGSLEDAKTGISQHVAQPELARRRSAASPTWAAIN